MKEVNIFRAQPIGSQVIDPVTITISQLIPDQTELGAGVVLYRNEAARLHAALLGSLPGGTYDQLLALMHQNKASLFQVSYGRWKGEGND